MNLYFKHLLLYSSFHLKKKLMLKAYEKRFVIWMTLSMHRRYHTITCCVLATCTRGLAYQKLESKTTRTVTHLWGNWWFFLVVYLEDALPVSIGLHLVTFVLDSRNARDTIIRMNYQEKIRRCSHGNKEWTI